MMIHKTKKYVINQLQVLNVISTDTWNCNTITETYLLQ